MRTVEKNCFYIFSYLMSAQISNIICPVPVYIVNWNMTIRHEIKVATSTHSKMVYPQGRKEAYHRWNRYPWLRTRKSCELRGEDLRFRRSIWKETPYRRNVFRRPRRFPIRGLSPKTKTHFLPHRGTTIAEKIRYEIAR